MLTRKTKDNGETGGELTIRENGEFAIMNMKKDIKSIVVDNFGADGLRLTDLERITVPAGGGTMWEVPTIDSEGVDYHKTLTGIIIGSQTGRKYWKTSFDETGGGTPPDCFSADGVDGIGNPGGQCASCPNAKFGTADNGRGRGQACSEFRSILMVMQGEILPVVITAPAMSLNPIRKYLRGLVSRQLPIHSVYTELALETDKNQDSIKFSRIVPRKVGDVEKPELVKAYAEAIKPYLVQVTEDLLRTRDSNSTA